MFEVTMSLFNPEAILGHTFPNGYRVTKVSVILTSAGTQIGVILARSDNDGHNEFVTATVTDSSLRFDEWMSGHYFNRKDDASADYAARVTKEASWS